MTLKDKLYIGVILGLLLVIVFYKKGDSSSLEQENKKLKDLIVTQYNTIDSLTKAQVEAVIQIDSLKNVRAITKIKYKTIYEEYKTKDSLVNSLSVDSIIQLWTKRYHLSQAQ